MSVFWLYKYIIENGFFFCPQVNSVSVTIHIKQNAVVKTKKYFPFSVPYFDYL